MDKFLLLILLVMLISENSNAQKSKNDSIKVIPVFEMDTLMKSVPVNRALFSDKVKALIKQSDLKDGEVDNIIELEDTLISRKLTEAFLYKVPKILVHIESMNTPHPTKIKYYRILETRMRQWNNLRTTRENATYIQKSVENFDNILKGMEENSLAYYISKNKNIISLDNAALLQNYPELKGSVFEAVGLAKPEMMISRLPEFVNEPYADPIIAAAARVVPNIILNYALSTSILGKAVRRSSDAYVKTIVAIADQSDAPQKALLFLDEINEGRKTIKQIDDISKDKDNYFKELVSLKLQGTSKVEKTLDEEINFRGLQYVRVTNELHESAANIRFKSLMDFNAEELYFMMIGSQDEIYTSSFMWMFDRMMEKMKPMSGDEFLEKVHKNRFRTFLRMAAGYNEISKFLSSMDEIHKNELMKEFVSGLEKGTMDDLEDAVDVADAFGSLTDPNLISFLKDEILQQYHQKINEKGTAIYSLLYTIFNSSDEVSINENFKNTLPPITYIPLQALKNKEGKIVQQVFFYGDKDGMGAFNGYLNLFRNNNWKIEKNKYWATITATGKVPIEIYVNIPLPEEAEENDVFAQKKLQKYIDDNSLEPSIVIHRGHSYYLPSTLEHLTPAAKIVILGSCGGYHNLAKVLDASPDAHIISSKQVGAYRVNTPIINAVNKSLLSDENVDWVEIWKNLSKFFAAQGTVTNELFSDYVPPFKNLGAIFIKAYRKEIEEM